jgi:hypothetical protein
MVQHNLKDHEDSCVRELGKPFSKVHEWMDVKSGSLGRIHRMERHDILETPKQALELLGEGADRACVNHIVLDALDYPELNSDSKLRECAYSILMSKSLIRRKNHSEVSKFLEDFWKKNRR